MHRLHAVYISLHRFQSSRSGCIRFSCIDPVFRSFRCRCGPRQHLGVSILFPKISIIRRPKRIRISQNPLDQTAAICASCVPHPVSKKFALIFITLAYPETPFLGLALPIMEGPGHLAKIFLRSFEPRVAFFVQSPSVSARSSRVKRSVR